jgi:hypothetical protein
LLDRPAHKTCAEFGNSITRCNCHLKKANQGNQEVDMLLHLPIAIIATLSPIAVSNTVPQFNIAKECRFEGGSSTIVDRCSRDETAALAQLRAEWGQFGGADQKTCRGETTIGGFESYVELLTCLEMARDAATTTNYSDDQRAEPESRPMLAGRLDQTIGKGR